MMIVLTGASSGIGAAAAVELARRGRPVLASGRHPLRLARVWRRMRAVAPAGLAVPEMVVADLSAKAGIEALAEAVASRPETVTALALNAGMEAHSYRLNNDGLEMTLAVNHAAPVYLTHLLWDRLHADHARVVVTASSNHADADIDPDDLAMAQCWSSGRAYDASKLANVLFVAWLRPRTSLPVVALHPGSITTALNRESRTYRVERLREFFTYDRPAKGAQTLVHLATDPDLGANSPAYWTDARPAAIGGRGEDRELASRLMDRTQEALGFRFGGKLGGGLCA